MSVQATIVREKCFKLFFIYIYISLSKKFTNKEVLRGNKIFLYSTLTEKKTIIRSSADFEAPKTAVVIDNQLSLFVEVCSNSRGIYD